MNGDLEWEFTLRAGARFWDGTPVTAADVVACWRSATPRFPGETKPWFDVVAKKDRRLVVSSASSRFDLPRELARSQHAVSKPADFSGWPVGSGTHRPGGAEEPDASGRWRILTAYPVRTGAWTVLRFLRAPGATPQQLLDAGVDVLIGDDAAELAEPEFAALPLSWTTTYAVLCTTRSARDRLAAALPPDAREALARDVVRGSARAAEPPRWWSEVDACAVGFSFTSPYFERDERIVYVQHDGRARALAERLVAVGLAPSARGLEPGPFATVLGAGGSTAYVLALPSFAASPCGEAQALVRSAPWLLRGSPREREERRAAASPAAESPLGQVLHTHTLALVETRGVLWARRGLVGIVLAADGTPRLEGIGWEKPAGSP